MIFENYTGCYDLLYQDKDYSAECEYVLGLLSEYASEGRTFLDLGCGTGRHAAYLARQGYTVTGLDRSREMLDVARKSTADVDYVQGDVRNFELHRQFDAVFSLFHVMSYQVSDQDVHSALKQVWKHIRPGGLFIFDFWHGPGVLNDLPEKRERFVNSDGRWVRRSCVPTMIPEMDAVDIRLTGDFSLSEDAQPISFDETHRMRYFTEPWLAEQASRVGFATLETRGWLTDRAPDESDWLAVTVLKKPGTE